MSEARSLQATATFAGQKEVRKQITLLLPDETRALMAELMQKSEAKDEAELLSLALGVLEFALWAKEQGLTVAAVDDEGHIVAELEW